MDLSRYAPGWSQMEFADVPLWAWAGIPLRLIVGYALAVAIGRAILGVTNLLFRNREAVRGSIGAIVPPVELLLGVIFFRAGKLFLPLGDKAASYVIVIALYLNTLAVAWLFLRLATLFCNRLEATFKRKGRRQAQAIIPLLRRLMKGAVAVLAVLFLLENLGFNVSAMLAGLGIGGVAIALASQKTVENLFGGVMLVLDQPVRVGDFGKFGDYMGTVEDIGLRSTRIRTLDRTLVTIPNGDFSQMKLESFTVRDMLRFSETFYLAYHTPVESLRAILDQMIALFGKDERIAKGFHIRLVDFSNNGLAVEIFSYVKTSDNDIFLAIREELFLAIMQIVRGNGSDFALPAQTLYTGWKEPEKPADSAAATTATVKTVVAADVLADAAKLR